MVANSPGILPKAALFGSKAIYYPFTIPKKLNDSATTVGAVNHTLVKGFADTLLATQEALQPRGPAKWLFSLADRVSKSVDHSAQIAQRNKDVFWDPFSNGTEQVGRAFAGPGAYWYAKKSGIEQPTADAIYGALNSGGFFHFPSADEMLAAKAPVTTPGSVGEASAAPPVSDGAATVEAASQGAPQGDPGAATQGAAEGAGQVAVA